MTGKWNINNLLVWRCSNVLTASEIMIVYLHLSSWDYEPFSYCACHIVTYYLIIFVIYNCVFIFSLELVLVPLARSDLDMLVGTEYLTKKCFELSLVPPHYLWVLGTQENTQGSSGRGWGWMQSSRWLRCFVYEHTYYIFVVFSLLVSVIMRFVSRFLLYNLIQYLVFWSFCISAYPHEW